MGKPILLILSHSIEEHDQVDLLSRLGYDVFSLGGYIDPHHPHDPKRPAVMHAAQHPDLVAAVDALGVEDNIGAAAAHVPDAVLEWLGDDGIIVAHHYLESRIYPQWARLRDWMHGAPGRRIVRRTVGQSVEGNEDAAYDFVADGLETVRYSPKERNIPGFTGEDALIRFWADPDLYGGWTGEDRVVGNVTQHLFQRHPFTNAEFAQWSTWDLPRTFAGPGSTDHLDGIGELEYDAMRDFLRRIRAYVYTGTQPASYTLGLLEAMMTGTPIVSIGPSWMRMVPYGPDLFEGHELALFSSEHPDETRRMLRAFLDDHQFAAYISQETRARALELFHPDIVGAQWQAFLG